MVLVSLTHTPLHSFTEAFGRSFYCGSSQFLIPPSHSLKHFSLLGVTHSVIWRRQWHPTPVLLPGKSHGWRSLVGSSPWGCQESGTTERLHFHFSLSCIGEGNGNPLQYSCLENPMEGGAWQATVHRVSKSQTRLSDFTFTFRILLHAHITICPFTC